MSERENSGAEEKKSNLGGSIGHAEVFVSHSERGGSPWEVCVDD